MGLITLSPRPARKARYLPAEPTTPASPSRTGTIWKLAVSVALLALLAWTQDLSGVARVFAAASPWWLLVSAALMFVEQTLTALTWGMLLAARGLKVGTRTILHIYYLSFFLGTWLPSSTGPDFVRTYYLARRVDGYEAVGSMLLLRFISLLGLGLFAVGGIYLVPQQMFPMSCRRRDVARLASGGGKHRSACRRFHGETAALGHRCPGRRRAATAEPDSRQVARCSARLPEGSRSVGRGAGGLAACPVRAHPHRLFAARALGATVPLSDFLLLVPVTTLITLLPISKAGFGVREGSFVYFFSRVGMAEPVAFGLGLLVFGLSLVLWAVGAVLYWRDRP